MYRKIYTTLIILFTIPSLNGFGQLLVDNSLTPDSLAKLISGEGVQIFNAQIDCGVDGYGKYDASNTPLGIEEGLVLTTGTIFNAIGPNDVGNKTHYFPPQDTPDGYPLLDNYTGRTTWEYCEFEFDIIPQGDTIKFDFVFASEEYEEWVGSQYNDVFGFFISGPGIVGDPGAGNEKNIALIPGTSTAVTINNVNQSTNTQYYENNDNDPQVQYDGYTKNLTAISAVQPCQTYHLKLVVADASDKLWDSGVFIEKIESNNILVLSQTAGNIDNMVEGCNYGEVLFTRQTVTNQPLTIDYWINGTATNGVDYPQIGSNPSPIVAKQVTIPANQATASVQFQPYADGIAEPAEYVMIYLGNPYCSSMVTDSLQFFITDSLFPQVSPISDSICLGETIELTSTGGSSFSWSPANGLSDPFNDSTQATPTTSTLYTLTTTASFCSESSTVYVHVGDIQVTEVINDVSCYGNNNGSINITVTGAYLPITYQWSGPGGFSSSSEDLSNLSPGTYQLSITDNQGCTAQYNYTVTEPSELIGSYTTSNFNGYQIDCYGNLTGTVDYTVSGGTTPYNFSWSGPNSFSANTEDINNLEAGLYQLTLTDNNGCTINELIQINQPDELILSATTSDASCFSFCDGSIDASITGGFGSYSISWDNGATTEDLSSLCTGSFDITVTDDNSCTQSASYMINEPSEIQLAISASNSNCSQSDGEVAVAATGGVPGYTYQWDDAGNSTTATVNNLPAGTYNIVVTDNTGCTANGSATVNDQAGGSVDAVVDLNATCFGYCDGQASATMTGGTAPYTYSWSTGGNGTTETNLCAGTHSIVVTDFVGCSTTDTITILEPGLLTLNTSETPVSCNGLCDGEAIVTISGGTTPYTIQWDDPSNQNTLTASGLCTGTYTVSVTDNNGCSTSAPQLVSEPNALSINFTSPTFIGGNHISCNGELDGQIDATPQGGTPAFTYAWTGPNGYSSSTEDISNLEAGTYSLNITDNNGCAFTDDITLTEPNALSLSISNLTYVGGENISCYGLDNGESDITVGGGTTSYTYSWTGPAGFTSSNEDITGLSAGNYYISILDANGCSIEDSTTITEPMAIQDTIDSPTFIGGHHVSCFGANDGTAQVSAYGGTSPYSYAWTGTGGYTGSGSSIGPLTAGTYYTTITDANSCVKTDSITLTEPEVLSTTLSSPTYVGGWEIACTGDSSGIVYTSIAGGISGYNYSWTGANGYNNSSQNIYGVPAGTYYLNLADTNGCSVSDSIVLTESGISLDAVVTSSMFNGGTAISCFGLDDAWLNVVPSGGEAGYTIAWRGPDNFNSDSAYIDSLPPGNYEVAVTDTNSCVAVYLIDIIEPDEMNVSWTEIPSSCGNSNGSIDLTVSGGIPSYEYSWSNGATTEDLENILGNEYIFVATDTNGCTLSDTINLVDYPELQVSFTSQHISCYGLSDGWILVEPHNGTPPYTFDWDTGDTTAFISNLSQGGYNLTLTDTVGCETQMSIPIFEPDSLILNLDVSEYLGGFNISDYQANDGTIAANVTGGTPEYQYLWSTNQTDSTISDLGPGSYSVVVTDSNGCVVNGWVELTEPHFLQMPTGVSPNNDGRNDFYVIRGIEIYPENSLTVFNRWGNIVYTQNDYQNNWNGTNSNGEPLPDGTYFVLFLVPDAEIKMENFIDIRR